MNLDLFVRGLAIGFAVAFALGPIGLLVIRRTIDRGWVYGFVSGAGVATADASYAAIAALGLAAVTEALVGIDRPLAIVGGAVLVLMAAITLRAALFGPTVVEGDTTLAGPRRQPSLAPRPPGAEPVRAWAGEGPHTPRWSA